MVWFRVLDGFEVLGENLPAEVGAATKRYS